MAYKWKDVWRGLILSEMVHAGRDTKLSLIECGGTDSLQIMEVNADANLYFKHATPLKIGKKNRWQFVFNQKNIAQIREIHAKKPVALALLCGPARFRPEKIETVFISPADMPSHLKLDADEQQIINVECRKGRYHVIGSSSFGTRPELLVKRNALRNWK